MKALRYLGRSTNLLNIILLLAVAAAAIGLAIPFSRLNAKYVLPAAKVKAVEQEEKAAEPAPSLSQVDFAVIGERNLFHPDRKIPIDKKSELPKPELILYGTLITDSMSVAYIEDKKSPVTTAGRGKRQTAAKKGDVISGFTLTEISVDKIVLVRGDERMTVALSDNEKDKRKTVETTTPAKVQPGQPAQRPAAQQPARPAVQQPARPTVQPGTGPGERPTAPALPPTLPRALRGAQRPGQQQNPP